jgi:hypothetical protein
MRAVKMRVVDSGKPEPLSTAIVRHILVEQHPQADALKVGHYLEDVVVAENRQRARPQFRGNAREIVEAIVKVSGRMVGKIAGDHRKIVRG